MLHNLCRGAFIPFLVAGDPDLNTTAEAILELDRAGADIIELGVPYSVCTWRRQSVTHQRVRMKINLHWL